MEDISALIQYVYYIYNLLYVEYQDKRYYTRHDHYADIPQPYCDEEQNLPTCEDHDVDDYGICPVMKDRISPEIGYDIKYVYDRDELTVEDQNHYNISDLIIQLKDTDILDFGYDIHIYNLYGQNNDHRGADHTKIKLPFIKEVKLERYINFSKFIDTLFEFKSHKFDTNYELYCGCSIAFNDGMIIIKLSFDHGS